MKNNRYIAAMVGLLLMMGATTTAYGQIIKGKVFGGGQLAQVNSGTAQTACNVTINSGDVYGKVYGGGEGVKIDDSDVVLKTNRPDVAKVTGNVNVKLRSGHDGGGTAWQDVFGGGALAKVVGDTYVEMSGSHIAANLFGGGEGNIKTERDAEGNLVITYADITGNTKVEITGGDIVWDRTSMDTPLSVTTYTYTKTIDGKIVQETYTTSDASATTETIKAYFESIGYKVTSVDSNGNVDGVYTFTVHGTTPTIVLTEEVVSTDTERITELVKAGYIQDVNKTVTTALADGEIVYWDTNKESLPTTPIVTVDGKKYANSLFYNDATKRFLIKHNIFGGGYIACRVGKYNSNGELESNGTDAEGHPIPTGSAQVSLVSGMFGADLMGTQQWKDAYNDNQDPHFYVFGGGFGAYTSVHNTEVQIGVNEEITVSAGETDEQWAKPHNRLADNARPKRVIGGTPNDPEIGIADNSYGEPGYTVLGVLGGGYAGIVTGNTDVRVGGNTFMHRVYGGGYGQLAAYNELREATNAHPKDNRTGTDWIFDQGTTPVQGTFAEKLHALNREDLGIVMGNTYVKTDGGYIQGDVFGGGAGVESAWFDGSTYKELDDDHKTASKDFTMGEVKGATEVEITGSTLVLRSVYGGGDVANVRGETVGSGENDPKQTASVTVKSGTIVDKVFGGGNGRVVSKVTPASVDDHTVTVGGIFGNTLVSIEDTYNLETDTVISSPYIYGDIYGGCGYGQIKEHSTPEKGAGNTVVNIKGGKIGGNIFGGGLGNEPEGSNDITSANVAGTTNVTIDGGSALWDMVSDENGNISKWDVIDNILTTDEERDAVRVALVTGDTQIFKKLLTGKVNEKFFDVENLAYTKDHNIYGGGDRVCKVAGNANVTVNHALITDAVMLDPSNSAGLCWAAGIDNKEHPQFSVFGGGYGPNTTVKNAFVKYQCGKNEILYTKDEATAYNTEHADEILADPSKAVKPGDHKADYSYLSQAIDRGSWAAWFGNLVDDWDDVDESEKDSIYGGNNLAGIWRYAVSQLAWSPGIPNLIMRGVFGGGYAGLVEGNTDVTVSDFSCLRYIYGGGLGSQDYLGKYDKDNRAKLYNRLGEVGGNANVVLSGGVVSKDLYGGGAGIEPKKLGSDTDFTDLVDMARVKGKTSVIISGSPTVTKEGTKGTVVVGDVFGGGDVANVGMEDAAITGTSPATPGFVTSQVIINSGCMLGQVFAGGNGRTKELCSGEDANHVFGYQKVGAVYGNTLLDVNGFDEKSSEGEGAGRDNITYIFKRMFGGGNNGSIRQTTASRANSGHTYVSVNGGYFAYNVFGGGVGTINVTKDDVTGEILEDNNTYSYVEGDTHVKMKGGLAIVDQYWDKPQTIEVAPGKTIEVGMRQWASLKKKDGATYSAQYDPEAKKLLINHNIYAGCRNAGYVLGSTYLTMNKGYIRSSLRVVNSDSNTDDAEYSFFKSNEWKEIYEKIGSPHFCIFGGGYGENTHVKGNTYVDIDIDANDPSLGLKSPQSLAEEDHNNPAAQRFEGGQSVMDIIGGGYSGDVAGATHVKISNDVYARNIFGGSFYAPVSQTNIQINSINCDNIFGGGMMGNVEETTVKGEHLDLGCGDVNLVVGTPGATTNSKIFINNNVYGGNDVSGEIKGQVTTSIFGGKIYNNVYGAGNGNYLYALNDRLTNVTAHEYYEANGQVYPLVYEVPLRNDMDFSVKSATEALKIVDINTYRPRAEKVVVNLAGTEGKLVNIDGNVFGGGNTATVSTVTEGNRPSVTMNIGSYCNIGGVYMGADGEAMFQEENGFMDAFQKINVVDLTNTIDWIRNPLNRGISETYLPVKNANRPKVYPHVLDLYFEPVEMSVQPFLNWCSGITLSNDGKLTVTPTSTKDASGFGNTTIGTFVCGGNRGNMNVEPWHSASGIAAADYGGNVDPDTEGQIINYLFPAGLTITNRIVGGCNEANYTLGKVTHVGGYLLGGREHDGTETNLTVECEFGLPKGMTSLLKDGKPLTNENGDPLEQRNVYGGCYKSGTVNGDINIDFHSSMLKSGNTGDKTTAEVARAYFGSEVAMGNVYGAGYGPESYVYGDIKVTVDPATTTESEYAAMSVYGGGQMGNVIGNTTVRVLNGHLGKSAVGGSYAGYMWGSTQVLVGYPKYYIAQQGGKYNMFRADKWNVGDGYKNHDGSDVVKQKICLMPGDIVSEDVFNAIAKYDAKNGTNQATIGNEGNFSAKITETPAGGWDGINITIDEAAYGGGYSLASGSSVAAGTYTVKKYDETMSLDGDYNMSSLASFVNHTGNTTTKGYGGNSTVLIWDNNSTAQTKDHIKISTQTMKEVFPKEGDDLFSYYVAIKDSEGKTIGYRYIYQEGEYFYSKDADRGAQYYQQAFESDSEGGIYGDGRLSFVEGFRNGDLVGYGFAGYNPNGALVINTFQRMDILRLKDCAVAVLGARDYTVNEVSTTPYSLARIGELHMEAENVTNFSGDNLAPMTTQHSRNYLGLSNNIHYIGAVNSNVDFNAKYHYGNKDEDAASGAGTHSIGEQIDDTYRQVKQSYMQYKDVNEIEFQKRNDGTAANMIGISSGYAMKVQNVKTTDAEGKEEHFYGPIVGVIEMNLIDVREDEGGGYVYADNIHHRKEEIASFDYTKDNYDQVPTAKDKDEDFLETSGNFVFPYDKLKNRYIVDDCFPTGFVGNEAKPEAHYWYVTGFNYYYNARITGYTYDSSGDEVLEFFSKKDNLLTLAGAKAGQTIKLQSLKWRSGHSDADGFVACDLEIPAGDVYEDVTSALKPGEDVTSYYVKDATGFVNATGTYDSSAGTHYYSMTPAIYEDITSKLQNEDDLTYYYVKGDDDKYTAASGKYDKENDTNKYYQLAYYQNVTEEVAKGADVSSYYTKSGETYVAATGTYVDGTTYYKKNDDDNYTDVTEKVKSSASVTSYYAEKSDGTYEKASNYYVSGTTYYTRYTPAHGNTPVISDEHYMYDHYNLYMGTADDEGKYSTEVQKVKPDAGTDLKLGIYYADAACEHQVTEGTADGNTEYYQKLSGWDNLPLTDNLLPASETGRDRNLTNALASDGPTVAFMLKDNVDNSGEDYFNKFMAQPCKGTVVLTCDAMEDDGATPIKGYVPIPFFFTRSGEAGNYVYTKMADNTQLTAGTDYYYFGNGNDYHAVNSNNLYYYNKAQQRHVPVVGDEAVVGGADAEFYTYAEYKAIKGLTELTESEFNGLTDVEKLKKPGTNGHFAGPPISAEDLKSGSQDYTFYDYTNRVYTYTIYLTIDYVHGPDVSGNLRIWNCALPGEKIKIDMGTIAINSDASMSQTSAIWKIGDWRFDQAHPFDPEADENKTDEMLKDVEFSEADGCIYVPAYYFMNGYPVQYFFTVNGIDRELPVQMNPNGQDHLTIHNYHRMKPRNADGVNKAVVDFKLDEALKRINEETEKANAMPEGTEEEKAAKAEAIAAILPEPRIYIADASDLNELPRFLGEKATLYYSLSEYNDGKEESAKLEQEQFDALPSTKKIKGEGAVGSKYDFGKHMQFHLLNDITVNNVGIQNLQIDHYGDLATTADFDALTFKGTLNGNGYVISDLGVKKGDFRAPGYLFPALSTVEGEGNVYNLGLKEGVITKGDAPVNGTKYPKYHTSYTWSNKTVYRIDGTAVATTKDGAGNTYTDNDWRYGKVTYDLNQYYLEARKADIENTPDAQHYVEDLYHNGDYLYARWETASPEYLRTAASQYDANYNSATTYHRVTFNPETYELSHPVDENRAVYNDDAIPADPDNGIEAKPATLSHYAPLYEADKHNSVLATDDEVRNDFLFFGQKLNADTKTAALGGINTTIPEHIDADRTHKVDDMGSRVYRAGGYYAGGKKEDRYQPADNTFYHNHNAYVHDNGITAIDFHDLKENGNVFYSPVVDYKLTGTGLNRANAVTRNLLVYANSAADVDPDDGFFKNDIYGNNKAESDIKVHVIVPACGGSHADVIKASTDEPKPEIEYFHLVERAHQTQANNDFYCPIQFKVTKRAWYERKPVGYRNMGEPMWEGITLPFTVEKVTAFVDKPAVGEEANGEITHFYDDSIRNHEYWLRGLVKVDGDGATFSRPGTTDKATNEDDLFCVSNQKTDDYTFVNEYFAKLYEGYDYGSWYKHSKANDGENIHKDYVYLTKEIPYIVAFPGNDYYEFSMEGSKIYDVENDDLKPANTHRKSGTKQNVRYESGLTTIDESPQEMKTEANGFLHNGTFLALNTKANAAKTASAGKDDVAGDVQGLSHDSNDHGKVFDKDSTAVLPFRTYMSHKTLGAAPRRIYILENSNDDEEDNDGEDMHPAQDMSGKSLTIEVRGLNVIVHSTFDDTRTVSVYRVNGQLVHIHKAPTGESTFTLPGDGLYIINGKKIAVK